MNRYEDNIFGLIPRDEWLDVGFQVTRPNDPIDGLFGDERTNNIVAKWQSIAAEYQIPMMAQFHGFDTEAQTTFRIPVDTHNIEKGLIKVKINQSERMRELMRSGVQQDEMYDYIINDGIRLADQVVTRTKVAKNELMATGKVTIKENELDLTVDYGVSSANLEQSLNVGAGQDVVAQLETIVEAANAKGVTLTGLLTSRKVISLMRKNDVLQKAINGNYMTGVTLRMSALESFLSEEFGINEIITNDLTYGATAEIDASTGRPSITTKRYFPINKASFFATNPSGRMGVGLWGDPPEVDAGRFYPVSGSQEPFVYVMQWMETDPAVLWTKASGLFIPVLFNPDSLWVATVTNVAANG